jgi:hypothetical protein
MPLCPMDLTFPCHVPDEFPLLELLKLAKVASAPGSHSTQQLEDRNSQVFEASKKIPLRYGSSLRR